MSINFADESEYANDMDELDDLTATAHPTNDKDIGEYLDELTESTSSRQARSTPDAFDLCLSDDEDDESPNAGSSAPSRVLETAEADALKFFDMDDEPTIPPSSAANDKREVNPAKRQSVIMTAHSGSSAGTPEEEQDKKRVLLVQIGRYRETWPFLEEVITFPPNMHKKSPEKLEEIRNECSGRVQNRNCMKGLRVVFNGAMSQVETFVTTRFSSVELQGFAKACEMDEVVQDSIKELEIKYLSSSGVMAPEARLIMALMLVAYSTHNKNRTTRLVQGVAHSRAPPLGQKYQDL